MFKMETWQLRFDEEIPRLNIDIDVPLLIDKDFNVLIGNCLRKESLFSEVNVIQIENDVFLKKVLKGVELALIAENDLKRFHTIEKEIKEYLSSQSQNYDQNDLFNVGKETKTIEETSFFKPPDYNFSKGKRKKESDEDLLSRIRELLGSD